MLRDLKDVVERLAANSRLRRQIVQEYGAFLRMLFGIGDWFVTLTFRDRHQDSCRNTHKPPDDPKSSFPNGKRKVHGNSQSQATGCPPDPRLGTWEPDSKYRRDPGPPVRDAALREIEHFLLELGWEAAGHTRQELFDRLADGLSGSERKNFAKKLCRKCLCCALLDDPVTFPMYYEVHEVATTAIGWVIAEEFGRVGGRWHVHLLVTGVTHLRRKKWWKRAFVRFGRSRIEALHG